MSSDDLNSSVDEKEDSQGTVQEATGAAYFTSVQCKRLSELYRSKQEEFEPESRKESANLQRKKAWKWLEKQFNAENPTQPKNVSQLKKKWANIKSRAKEEFQLQKKSKAKTGGGPARSPPNEHLQIIMDMNKESHSFQGIKGAVSSPLFQSDSLPAAVASALSAAKKEEVQQQSRLASAAHSSAVANTSDDDLDVQRVCHKPTEEQCTEPQAKRRRRERKDEKSLLDIQREVLELDYKNKLKTAELIDSVTKKTSDFCETFQRVLYKAETLLDKALGQSALPLSSEITGLDNHVMQLFDPFIPRQ